MARAVKARPPKTYRASKVFAPVQSGTRAVTDNTDTFVPAEEWLGEADTERHSEALVEGNRGLLSDLGVEAWPTRRRGVVGLHVRSSSRVGAIPLLSPITGRPDFGLAVYPRFGWAGAGDMLAGTGFRVVPELLPLPDLPQSERRVPPWVLSSVVLTRMQQLLDAMLRRFAISEADLHAPRGAVDWTSYATTRFPVGRALDVPCRFPDLRDDEELRAAIHWVVRRHRESLRGQLAGGRVVRVLLELCDTLIARVAGTVPRRPRASQRTEWQHRPLVSRVFREGLTAIDWTVDERGLAGLSDLSGIAWRLDMERFFEAWVEAVASDAARRVGAVLRVGRTEQTRVPLLWTPPAAGSQRSLLPDVVLGRSDVTVVIDAKYKRHAEQIERLGWSNVSEELREQHRADVLQALAYSTLFDTSRVVACLAYPATRESWASLVDRRVHVRRAVVRRGSRTVELALIAVPLSGALEAASECLTRIVHAAW